MVWHDHELKVKLGGGKERRGHRLVKSSLRGLTKRARARARGQEGEKMPVCLRFLPSVVESKVHTITVCHVPKVCGTAVQNERQKESKEQKR